MENVVGLQYTGTGYFDLSANNGLGEYKGYFVVLKPGQESDARDKLRAFSSAGAKNAMRVRDGVIALSLRQAEDRIEQIRRKLEELEGK